MLRKTLIIAALLVAPVPAFATKADADACAKNLKGDALKAYREAVVHVVNGSTLEQAFTKALKPKVDKGQMEEDYARRIGREAGDCARLVHREAGR
ncbi:hypothetical protein [Terrihabitans sp. B22-R8]|uniref:hypothetical protein n=1 Tax=Terrihabitans sp. B22-R8 TaxID=3425128 RepID=UPI00403C46FE